MPISEKAKVTEAIHRKLRAIAAVLLDPAATKHERTNAETLKIRLEKQLGQETTPKGAWTDIMYRMGRAVKFAGKPAEMRAPPWITVRQHSLLTETPSCEAEHMAAPTSKANVKILLANSEPSTHGRSVWTGRALQVGYDGLEIVGLAHLYSAL